MTNVAFVSGSSRGIGRAIALELAARGMSVAVNGRSASDDLANVVSEIRAKGGVATAIPGDVSNLAEIPGLLQSAEDFLGALTTLVANAGVGPLRRADLLDVEADSIMHCLNVNTVGPFFLLQSFARMVLARPASGNQHCSITLISSANATAASPNKGDYCVSKAGASMIAKLFAQRLSPHGVHVMEVRPGVIETDLSAAVIDEYRRRINDEGLTLLPRTGRPEDVARVVGCIAAGDMSYVTGSSIDVDGGLAMERF